VSNSALRRSRAVKAATMIWASYRARLTAVHRVLHPAAQRSEQRRSRQRRRRHRHGVLNGST
jgi:hypothetical protein